MPLMNYCPNCGFKFDFEGVVKCPKCKYILKDYMNYPHFCSTCGEKWDYSNLSSIEICEHCGVKKNDNQNFKLKSFLIEHSQLFVIFGVFIALSMYLTQVLFNFHYILPQNFPTNFFEISIGSSFLIAFIILIVIINEMTKGNILDNYYDFISEYMPSFPLGTCVKILFLIPLLFLISGLLIFLYFIYPSIITIFLSAVAVALAIILFLLGVTKITDTVFPEKDKSNVRKPISLYILLYSLATLIIAQLCLIFLTPIIQNRYNNPTLSLSISAFFISLFILGILGIITMIGIIAFSISIQRKERNGVQWGRKAIDLANSEKFDEALEYYNKALEADPYNAITWYNRGVLMGKLQRYEEGIQNFEKAIEINPTYEIAKKAKENFLSELNRTG